MRMTVTRRPDGSSVITSDNDGIMLTPTTQGRLIVVTGKVNGHPFDTVPVVLNKDATMELYAVLREIANA
jgi:hypothetical protein